MSHESSSSPSGSSLSRRTIVKSAAWSVPVIAVAATAPLAAASGDLPPATFWGTSATVAVVSGNVTRYQLFGTDANADDASLPVGSTIEIKPRPGVSVEPVAVVGAVLTTQPDGTLMYTIVADNLSLVDIRFRPTGPSGPAYDIVTTVPGIAPYTETINGDLQ